MIFPDFQDMTNEDIKDYLEYLTIDELEELRLVMEQIRSKALNRIKDINSQFEAN